MVETFDGTRTSIRTADATAALGHARIELFRRCVLPASSGRVSWPVSREKPTAMPTRAPQFNRDRQPNPRVISVARIPRTHAPKPRAALVVMAADQGRHDNVPAPRPPHFALRVMSPTRGQRAVDAQIIEDLAPNRANMRARVDGPRAALVRTRAMRTPTALLISLLLTVPLAACEEKKEDKKEDKKGDKKPEDKKAEGDDAKAEGGEPAAEGGEPKPEGGAAGEVALTKTGLKGDAPAGTSVSTMMDDDMVQGPNLVVTIGKGEGKPKTGEEAQKEAEMYGPKDPKVETLEDGYVLTFTNEGGMGTNYWVNAYREIGGAAYWCSTTGSSQEQSDNAVAFCKSLRK